MGTGDVCDEILVFAESQDLVASASTSVAIRAAVCAWASSVPVPPPFDPRGVALSGASIKGLAWLFPAAVELRLAERGPLRPRRSLVHHHCGRIRWVHRISNTELQQCAPRELARFSRLRRLEIRGIPFADGEARRALADAVAALSQQGALTTVRLWDGVPPLSQVRAATHDARGVLTELQRRTPQLRMNLGACAHCDSRTAIGGGWYGQADTVDDDDLGSDDEEARGGDADSSGQPTEACGSCASGSLCRAHLARCACCASLACHATCVALACAGCPVALCRRCLAPDCVLPKHAPRFSTCDWCVDQPPPAARPTTAGVAQEAAPPNGAVPPTPTPPNRCWWRR